MAEHDERDSVASRDAFEKVCLPSLLLSSSCEYNRGSLATRGERTRDFRRASSRLAARDGWTCTCITLGGVYNAWFRFGERAWNIDLHSPSPPPPVPPCVPTHLFISRSERRRNSRELSLSASTRRVLFSLYSRPLYRWLSLLRYPFPDYHRNTDQAKTSTRFDRSFRASYVNCRRMFARTVSFWRNEWMNNARNEREYDEENIFQFMEKIILLFTTLPFPLQFFNFYLNLSFEFLSKSITYNFWIFTYNVQIKRETRILAGHWQGRGTMRARVFVSQGHERNGRVRVLWQGIK